MGVITTVMITATWVVLKSCLLGISFTMHKDETYNKNTKEASVVNAVKWLVVDGCHLCQH